LPGSIDLLPEFDQELRHLSQVRHVRRHAPQFSQQTLPVTIQSPFQGVDHKSADRGAINAIAVGENILQGAVDQLVAGYQGQGAPDLVAGPVTRLWFETQNHRLIFPGVLIL